MARPIYPQWPAQPPPGHPFQDEIDRRALRSFLDIASATPEEVAEYHKQEAIRAQDAKAREDEYQKGAAESAKINELEARRQAWDAMKQYQEEILTQELDDLRQASRDWEFEDPGWDKAERTKAQLESLYQRTDPRISNYETVKYDEDLLRMAAEHDPRNSTVDLEKYLQLRRDVGAFKGRMTDDEIEAWRKFYYGSSSADDI